MPSNDSDWLRPLYASEKYFAWSGHFGKYNTTLVLCLRQRQPFDATLARKAAVLWSRQHAVLQVCVRHRGLTPWFHKVPRDADLDFDVLENVDISNVVNDVRYKTYDIARGPLWIARLVLLPHQASPQSEQFLLQEDVPIYRYLNKPEPELQGDVWYALLVFSLQHCITDSTTNLILGRSYINILNKIQSNIDVKVNQFELSQFIAYELHPLPYSQIFKLYIPTVWKMLSNFFENTKFSSINLLQQKIHDANPTKSIRYDFSLDTTQKLMAMCNQKNVKLHSCFVTAINLAYYRVVKGTFSVPDTLRVDYVDAINMRRYFPRHFHQILGCHVGGQIQSARVSSNSYVTFWETARQSGMELHEKLTQRMPFLSLYWFPLAVLLTITIFVTRILGIRDAITSVYNTSNMKDISNFFHSTSTGIDVTDVFICGTGDRGSNFFTARLHTFGGRLQLAFDYHTNNIQPKLAKQIIRETKSILETLCKQRGPNVICQ